MGKINIIVNISEKNAKDINEKLDEVIIAIKNNKDMRDSVIALLRKVTDET